MAVFFVIYAVVGAVLYAPSRSGGEVGKGAYFVGFPFHALGMPVLSAFGSGLAGMLRSKGFWGAAFAGMVGLCLAAEADIFTAVFAAFVAVALGKLFYVGVREMIEG